MPSLDARLLALEQYNRTSCPALLLFYLCEQKGIPTPEQAAQIAQANKKGRSVKVIRFVCAEDSFPGFSGLPGLAQKT
ncbi:hypothetical protein NTGHW29_140082 [Candidatus Nitrotoga sp. HW29]|uniref:hypothetical protein n=1 Tax=Candidatus Nitrotoga sp. HW29 TaxID=2886963 RepID=UPI001EF28E70|nr:hypothetical protein [Candidatus Nitrotoga sp. HW29]CAH1903707.1 hypothetical protein NTGHW29_140082 [Candidatus Nitrotoga sp. HW29]